MGYLGIYFDAGYFTGIPTELPIADELFGWTEFEEDESLLYRDGDRWVGIYPDRILSNVVANIYGCWEWIGYRDNFGNGKLTVDGIKFTPQRYSYLCHVGMIPVNHAVVSGHGCTKGCCNPFHLRCIPKTNASVTMEYNLDGEFTYYIPRINPSTGKLLQYENGRRLTIQEKYTYIVGLNNAARYTGLDKRVIKRHTDPITRIFNHYSYMDACKDNGYREIIPTLCGIVLQY